VKQLKQNNQEPSAVPVEHDVYVRQFHSTTTSHMIEASKLLAEEFTEGF